MCSIATIRRCRTWSASPAPWRRRITCSWPYYRGYCRERLGRSGAADYLRASRLSTDYVFPNRPLTATVLRAALTSNASDSTARFLLGALYLSGGMVQEAVEEWEQVRRAGARFRTLHRNLGYAWFFGLHRPDRAEAVLSEGVAVNPANRDVYAGLEAVMSLLGRPASSRVAMLQRYPDLAGAPPAIVQTLALALAEAGRFSEADAPVREPVLPSRGRVRPTCSGPRSR